MKILIPNDSEFEIIKKHIVNFELDNRDLKKMSLLLPQKIPTYSDLEESENINHAMKCLL